MTWELSALELVAAVATVLAGAIVQGGIGIGFGIVLVPVLALLAPASLPATPLLLALPLTALVAARERGDVDWRALPRLLLGRVGGTVAAVWLLVVVTEATLEILFGVVVLAVAALSGFAPSVRPTPAAQVGAGFTSGLFATTAAIGGPPVALLYQARPGPELRATLGVVFFLGSLLSLAGLVVADRLALAHFGFALVLLPALLAGFAASRRLWRLLEAGWLRPAVLAFAAAAGALAIIRGLAG